VVGDEAREALAQRQAGAARALARLGQLGRVWPVLVHSAHPEARSRLLHRLGPGGVDVRLLAGRLEAEKDVSIRRALILALGEYTAEQVPDEVRRRVVRLLLAWYRDDPDAGIHAAIGWLLRPTHEGPEPRALVWGQGPALDAIDRELARRGSCGDARRGWYVNGQGQTLAVIAAREPFLMGSPVNEAGRFAKTETPHGQRIGRRFALATTPVTVAQLRQFLKAHPEVNYDPAAYFRQTPDTPAIAVTWFEAAQFCRWLSEQEGVREDQMCFPSVAEIEKCKDGRTPLRLPPDYLRRTGYRLPTGAEWEYACRAGAQTPRYYGSSVDLLGRYAWFAGNSRERPWPVGEKKPNDLGLFDMHGNVFVWCLEPMFAYPRAPLSYPAGDEEIVREVPGKFERVMRGGAFHYHAPILRAAMRLYVPPGSRGHASGFRVARTCE
jgi:formylglycine-generating enzyme required for sulfatase activity